VNWWHVGIAGAVGFFVGGLVVYTTTVFVLFKDWMR
jgi:hypothetical protein